MNQDKENPWRPRIRAMDGRGIIADPDLMKGLNKTISVVDALPANVNHLHMSPKIIFPIERLIAVGIVALERSTVNMLRQNVPP